MHLIRARWFAAKQLGGSQSDMHHILNSLGGPVAPSPKNITNDSGVLTMEPCVLICTFNCEFVQPDVCSLMYSMQIIGVTAPSSNQKLYMYSHAFQDMDSINVSRK